MRLSDGSYLEIPMVRVKTDGQTLENNGVHPHVRVLREFGDAGRDLTLEEGLRQLEKATRKGF